MTLSEQSLLTATSQLGVMEQPKGSNKGPEVEMYLKSVGLGGGFAWCMAFVYWCVNEASKKMNRPNPLVKTAGVMDQFRKTQLRILPKTSIGIKPGDIFILEFAHGLGHTGFVKSIDNGIVTTIEGNSNEDGSREGYEVCSHHRPISSFKGFIQLP